MARGHWSVVADMGARSSHSKELPSAPPSELMASAPPSRCSIAIDFWEQKLDAGYKIAPVGGSDSHDAGRTPEPTHSPVGDPTTVLFADELSEAGIKRAIDARHTYVKMFGNDGPDLRFEA